MPKSALHFLFWVSLAILSCVVVGFEKVMLNHGQAITKQPGVSIEHGMTRIGLNNPISSHKHIELFAARGEYEPIQIAVRAANTALTNVTVNLSDLRSKTGLIAATNITLYREHYSYIDSPNPGSTSGKNQSQGKGWYADGLIPFVDPITQTDLSGFPLDANPFSVSPNSNQVVLADIWVPRNTESGLYKGTFTVTSDQFSTTGSIALTVWNFELPLKPALQSSILLWEDYDKNTVIELLKHKLMPATNINPAHERELIDQWGLTSIRLPFWSGANVKTCKMEPPPSVLELKAAAAKHQPDLFLYVYSADEIDNCPNLVASMRQWASNIHQAALSNFVVMTPTPSLLNDNGLGQGRSAVDIWGVLPSMYDAAPAQIEAALQKGNQVWSYTALDQDDYSPKWLIDYAPINFRIMQGFINQSLGLTGTLYWRADLWTTDPWNDLKTFQEDDRYYPGEGMLLYPGQPAGITGAVPSLRLKWLREGVEDYEYIDLLKRLGQEQLALALTQQVGANWQDWSQDQTALLSVRQQLGEEISKRSLIKLPTN